MKNVSSRAVPILDVVEWHGWVFISLTNRLSFSEILLCNLNANQIFPFKLSISECFRTILGELQLGFAVQLCLVYVQSHRPHEEVKLHRL